MPFPENTEELKHLNLQQSNIETIDAAFLEYVEGLNIHCNTINGWQKVPVIWSSAERSFQIKDNREIRDKNGSLIPPIISIERSSVTKDPNKKGNFQSNLSPKDDRRYITKILNQDKTSNFANADTLRKKGSVNFITSKKNQKIVYQHIAIPIPIYITVEYKINILTNYQSQMNEAVQPLMARVAQNYFLIQKDRFKYECFMDQNFTQETVNLGDEERKYKSTITVKVLGYLIGEGENQEKPQSIVNENAVETKLPRENLSFVSEESDKKQAKQINPASNAGILLASGLTFKKSFLIGDEINENYTVRHNFNTRNLIVIVKENFDPYSLINPSIQFITENDINIDMGEAIPQNSYIVTIIG
jgi:hypothetical protein